MFFLREKRHSEIQSTDAFQGSYIGIMFPGSSLTDATLILPLRGKT